MNNVAELGIRVFFEQSGAAGFSALDAALQGLGYRIGTLASMWRELEPWQRGAVTIAGAGALEFAGLAAAMKYAVDSASEIETAMARVKIAFGLTDEQVLHYKGTLLELANNSTFSAIEIAQGLEALGQKGRTVADLFDNKMAPAMINLAQAIHTGPVEASRLLGSTLQTFDLQASDSARVVDLLDVAYKNGIPNVDQLQEALNAAAPAAASLGVKLEDLLPYLDFLAQRMDSGSQAGNALKNMFQSLQNPLPQAAKELSNLGIIIVNQTNPAIYDLQNRLAAVAKYPMRFDGTVESLQQMFQQAQKLQLIHTDATFMEWAVAAKIITNNVNDANGKFKGMGEFLKMVHDRMEELKYTPEQMGLAFGKLFNRTALKGMEDLGGEAGKTAKAIDDLIQKFGQTGQAEKDSDTITATYESRMKELRTTFKDLMGIIGGPLKDILSTLAKDLNTFLSPFSKMSPEVAQIISTFALFAAGTSLLAFVFGTLAVALTVATGPIAIILGVFAGLNAIAAIGALIYLNWSKIGPLLAPIGGFFKSIGDQALPSIKGIQKSFSDAFENPVLKQALKDLGGAWNSLTQSFGQTAPMWHAIGRGIQLALEVVIRFVAALVRGAIGFFTGLAVVFAGIVQVVIGIVQVITGIVMVIVLSFATLWNGLTGHTDKGKQNLINAFNMIGTGLKNILGGALNVVIGLVTGFVSGVVGMMGSLPQKIVGALSSLGTTLYNAGSNMIQMMGQGIQNAIGFIMGPVNNVANFIQGVLGHHSPAKEGPLSHDDEFMPNMMMMHAEQIRRFTPNVALAARDAAGKIRTALSTHTNANLAVSGLGISGTGVAAMRPVQINLYIGDKLLDVFLLKDLSKDLKLNGAERLLRSIG